MAGQPARSTRDARRRYAQNFLRSPAIAAELVDESGAGAHDCVLEIGAGSGTLTAELARRCRHVIAVERDPYWAARLTARFATDDHVDVIQDDILAVSLPDQPFRAVGSLPFNMTTKILRHLLDDPALPLERADLVVQWEVAVKRVSWPHDLNTICWAPWWQFTVSRRLPPDAFSPIPSVGAGVVTVAPRQQPLIHVEDRPAFASFARSAFASTPRHTVSRRIGSRAYRRLADTIGIRRDAPASQITVRQWVALFRHVSGST